MSNITLFSPETSVISKVLEYMIIVPTSSNLHRHCFKRVLFFVYIKKSRKHKNPRTIWIETTLITRRSVAESTKYDPQEISIDCLTIIKIITFTL